jgi:hypothetical protein
VKHFSFDAALLTLVIWGGALFMTIYISLLAYGFDEREISHVQAALAIVWAPVLFLWGGLSKKNRNSN